MSWDIQKARELYNIRYWGNGYFDINDQGHIEVRPDRNPQHAGLDLYKLAQELRDQGISLPILVRFIDILHDRVDTLCAAFGEAMAQDGYKGGYTAVYPIKVNQQRVVVEELFRHGGRRVGLEAGSKPELMAVLALSNQDGGVIVCNGYKDREYIRLALMGRQLGHSIYIVVEKLSELELVISESAALGIKPLIGVRARLASIGAGKWQNTGGEKSKFGLSAGQILQVVERLRAAQMLDSLQLLHVHLGSQIANIRDIQRGMREVARFYAELRQLGAPVAVVDVGGGLGIDYEGTRSRSYSSINYSVQEYANDVVHALWETCQQENLPHPHVITESGRALTAHHAALITNIIDVEQSPDVDSAPQLHDDDPQVLQDLAGGLHQVENTHMANRSVMEVYHDAVHWLGEAQIMYSHGLLTMEQRARAEQYYFATCWRVLRLLQPGNRAHREVLDELNEKLADKYFCNFSLFQSMPDVWAIQQAFPVIPLHRLNEEPTRRATLQDITCDSDGRIDDYVCGDGIEPSLPVHPWSPDQPYLVGMFLVGAYQEILGDMHNLFGDTAAVNVELTPDGGHRLSQLEPGDTVDEVLRYVHFDPADLMAAYQRKVQQADLKPERRQEILEALQAGIDGYTYLEE